MTISGASVPGVSRSQDKDAVSVEEPVNCTLEGVKQCPAAGAKQHASNGITTLRRIQAAFPLNII
ncbi:MAG: hypothetical protein A2X28_02600 [Elusimicrobia bacterium GWA2_56_46]|nr:MAG: hypothetical protein A2X28_02600 [Elusimicrobia bacterium GWA2_56_46]OGR55349.1 MAG: hypothetical protein A2X39_00365 [Elusimicrobia bacterium GWC2_56_31]HBB67566.1 hypothetical protein [Elusimicrobiota bacterium]HBW23115.1 hypothetical protein [Elusimicrobiota bacterium]